MDRPISARLLQRLDAREIRHLTHVVATLAAVPASDIDTLIEQFADEFMAGLDVVGSVERLQEILARAFPADEAGEIIGGSLGQTSQACWARLSAQPAKRLVEYLRLEHPQTMAFVVSKLSPPSAAAALSLLPGPLRLDIVGRLAGLGGVDAAIVGAVETILSDDLLNATADAKGQAEKRLAEIINKLDPDEMNETIDSLAASRPETAAAVRKLLFTFDDIVKLPVKARALLFEKAPPEKVILSLKGKSPEFREFALSSMTNRARRMVEQELDSSGPGAPKEIAAARRLIAELALELAAKGEIEIGEPAPDERQE